MLIPESLVDVIEEMTSLVLGVMSLSFTEQTTVSPSTSVLGRTHFPSVTLSVSISSLYKVGTKDASALVVVPVSPNHRSSPNLLSTDLRTKGDLEGP